MGGDREIFGRKLIVINVGLGDFYDALKEQGVETAQVDWRPPAGGDPELLEILDKLAGRQHT